MLGSLKTTNLKCVRVYAIKCACVCVVNVMVKHVKDKLKYTWLKKSQINVFGHQYVQIKTPPI